MPELTSNQILTMLDRFTATLPVSQLLGELQVAVERISFSKLHTRPAHQGKVTLAEINLLFEDQISEEVLSFVRWLAEKRALAQLADETGILFIDECSKLYRATKEVRFITPIVLSDKLQTSIRQQLVRNYTVPVRVVFEVSPNVMAGFVLQDGTHKVDRSLRAFSQLYLKRYIEKRFAVGGLNG